MEVGGGVVDAATVVAFEFEGAGVAVVLESWREDVRRRDMALTWEDPLGCVCEAWSAGASKSSTLRLCAPIDIDIDIDVGWGLLSVVSSIVRCVVMFEGRHQW